MAVRDALFAINRVLDETLEGGESDLDPDTLWAVTWYSENGHKPGGYGRADAVQSPQHLGVQARGSRHRPGRWRRGQGY